MSRLIVGRRGVRASSVEETYIGFVSWFGSSDQKVCRAHCAEGRRPEGALVQLTAGFRCQMRRPEFPFDIRRGQRG